MPDYKITRISDRPAREWQNPKGGVVYYRDVMLDGWDKPVSIGKKSPDALQVGLTVTGTVERTGGEADKWHGAPMGSFGGGGEQAAPQGKYPARDDNTQESIARSVALKAAVDAATASHSKGVITTEEGILKTADIFLAWLQGSSESTNPKPMNIAQELDRPKEERYTSGYDRFKAQGQQLRQEPMPDFPPDTMPFEGDEIPY